MNSHISATHIAALNAAVLFERAISNYPYAFRRQRETQNVALSGGDYPDVPNPVKETILEKQFLSGATWRRVRLSRWSAALSRRSFSGGGRAGRRVASHFFTAPTGANYLIDNPSNTWDNPIGRNPQLFEIGMLPVAAHGKLPQPKSRLGCDIKVPSFAHKSTLSG